ncbi:MAG: UPF0182 family protein [Candidatus Scatovivens sp.]
MDSNKKNKIKNIVVSCIILIIFLGVAIDLRGEYLEIKEIGENYIGVFFTNLKYKYIMFLAIFSAVFAIFSINTKIIKRGLKKFFTEEKANMPRLPNFSISSIIAIIGGLVGQTYLMESYKLCLNNSLFGVEESVFGKDIGYYVFILPFIKKVIFFIIAIFLLLLIYTAIYYVLALNTYLDGVELETLKKNTFIKQLVSFAITIVILISSLIWIGSTDILTQEMLNINDAESTELIGASVADVTVKVWGYRILSILIIFDILILFKFIKKGNFKKCIITVSVVPIYLICMFVCLIYIKEIYLNSNEFDKEKQYISYNIENTKKAYGIDISQVELDDYDTITYSEVLENQNLIDNIPLINKDILETSIAEHQDNSVYYRYSDTNISLYDFENTKKLTYLTPRQILTDSNRSYNNKTFEYTHGYSMVLSSINEFDKNGYIKYYNSDITDENLNIQQPRIYFGTGENSIIVTNSKYGKEFDYPISLTINEENCYDGKAGLNLGFLDRFVLGLKNRNLKLALSSYVDKNSKIITNKNVVERAKAILPDIIYDENPYLVVTDEGKLVWVIDGYTVTSNYPYSQSLIIDLPNGEKQKINYIRNSVKVLVDSYDGTVSFYITDKYDPIIICYKNMYPNLFLEDITEDIKQQFIYPKYLYNIQSEIIKVYHDISEDVLYRGDDIWSITTQSTAKTSEIEPYYTMVRTIDDKDYKLGLVITYNKYNKQNIISYLVGTYENGEPSLSLYKFKSNSNVAGIVQLNNQIEQDETISAQLESINTTGTKLIKNIIIVPINNTLLYVEPIYQVMLNENTEVPIIKKVIVASGNKVAIGNNIEEAINNLFTDYSVEISIEDSDDIESVINSIIKTNSNLKESLDSNDFELIGKDLDTLKELIDKLEILKNKEEKNNINENQVQNITR